MVGEEDRNGQSADSKDLADITSVVVNKVRRIGQGRIHSSNYTSGLGKVASFGNEVFRSVCYYSEQKLPHEEYRNLAD